MGKHHMHALLFSMLFILSSLAFSAPLTTTYQAKIIKPDGQPLEAASVNFRFTILDPAASCILYVENYTAVNMTNSAGLISFSLGAGVRSYPVSGTAATFANIFDNATPSYPCQASGTYAPLALDSRTIVMQFDDSFGWQTMPAMAINAVPYSMYAGKSENSTSLNGKADTAFVEYSALTPLSCLSDQALHFNGVSFSCLSVGVSGSVTSSNVISALGYTPANGASVTTLTSNLNSTNAEIASVSSTVFSVSTLAAATAASFSTITSSQWTSSGSAVFYDSGNVGIGTSNPGALLDVVANDASPALRLINSSSTGFRIPAIKIQNYSTGQAGGSGLYIQNFGGTASSPASTGANKFIGATVYGAHDGAGIQDVAAIYGFTGSSFTTGNATGYLDFFTNAGSGFSAPQMRIAQSGNVGIGTSSPSNTLTVSGSGSFPLLVSVLGNNRAGAIFENNTTVGTDNTVEVRLKAYDYLTSSTVTVGQLVGAGRSYAGGNVPQNGVVLRAGSTDGSLFFQTGGPFGHHTRMNISASGNIAVGMTTNAGSALLQLGAGTSETSSLKLTSGTLLTSPQSGSIEYDGSQLYFTDGTNTRRTIATGSGSLSNSADNTYSGVNTFTGQTYISNNIVSTNSTTGSFVVSGGVGIGGALNVAGNTNIAGIITAASQIISTSSVSAPVIYADAGSAALPSFTFSTDSATGLWQPTSGALALSTAGLERVRVTSSGNVGIGTSAPTRLLSVVKDQDAITSLQIQNADSGTIAMAELRLDTDMSMGGQILAGSSSHTSYAKKFVIRSYSQTTNGLLLQSASGPIVLSASSNVGIGMTTPTARLQLAAGTSLLAPLKLTSGTLTTTPQSGTIEYDGSQLYYTDGTNTRRALASNSGNQSNSANNTYSGINTFNGQTYVSNNTASTNSTTGALVVSGGVGVGGAINVAGNITAAGQLISTSSVSAPVIYAGAGSALLPSFTFSTDAATGMWQPTSGAVALSTAGLERIRITSSGNIGIGTTSPQSVLHVMKTVASSETTGAVFQNLSSTASTGVVIELNPSSVPAGQRAAQIVGLNNGSNQISMAFRTSNANFPTEAMRINHFGNVGIGTTTPGQKLEVAGAIQSLVSNNLIMVEAVDGSGGYGSRIRYGGSGTNNSIFQIQGVADVPKLTIGASGNVGIGTTSPTALLHLAAGTTSNAPLKLTSGTLTTSAQSGTMEYDGFNFYLTDSTNTRRTIATGSSAGAIDNASNINSTGNITMTPTGSVIVSSTTASMNSQTGALIVKGGVGIAGDVYTSGTIVTSGKIGIGATPSQSDLLIGGGASDLLSTQRLLEIATRAKSTSNVSTTAQSVMRLGWHEGSQDLGDGEGVRISFTGNLFGSSQNTEYASIYTSKESNSDASVISDLRFATTATHGVSVTDRLVIKPSGNVGIGTSVPDYNLVVANTLSVSGNMVGRIRNSTSIDVAVSGSSAAGPRQELQIYSGVKAYGAGSDGAGIHLYGDYDTQHGKAFNPALAGGPIALMAGGELRTMISADGKVAMGNALWNRHDNSQYIGTLNIFDPSGVPAIYIDGASSSEGDIAFPENEMLSIGAVSTTTNVFGSILNITGSGKLGLGTETPTSKLSVHAASRTETFASNITSTWADVLISNPTDTLGAATGIKFIVDSDGDDTDSGAGIAAVKTTSGTHAYDLVFITDRNGFSSSEGMRLTSTGNVGIGTSAPTSKIHIYGDSQILNIENNSNSAGTGGILRFGHDQSGSQVPMAEVRGILADGSSGTRAGHLSISTTTGASLTERIRVTSTGNVGIGMTTPTARLQLVAGNSSLAPLKLTSGVLTTTPQSGTIEYDGSQLYYTDGTNTRRALASNSGNQSNSANNTYSGVNTFSGQTYVSNNTASTNSSTGSLVVSGGVGIGGALNVTGIISGSSTIKGTGFRANQGAPDAADSSTNGYAFGIDGDTGIFSPGSGASNGVLAFYSNNAERMRISESGNVGIGTTNPIARLSVYQATGIASDVFHVRDTVDTMDFVLRYNGTNGYEFRSEATGIGQNYLSFIGPTGNVGVGTTSPSEKLEVAGNILTAVGSINAGGSATANVRGQFYAGGSSVVPLKLIGASGQTADLLQINTSTGAAVIVAASGSVGIGTMTPTKALHVVGDLLVERSANTASLEANGANDTDLAALRLVRRRSDATAPAAGFGVSTHYILEGSVDNVEIFAGQTGVIWEQTQTNATTARDSAMYFATMSDNSRTEKLRITSAGNVGIGTTNPGYKLDVSGTINIASGSALAFGGTNVCTAAGCTSSSDERLKENIKPLGLNLEKLLSLNAVQYDWKDKSKYGDKHQIGFLAQNLEKVYPEVVYTDKNTGLKSVAYGHLVAPIIEALKTIYARVLDIETRVNRQIASVIESKADKSELELLKAKSAQLESENAALKSYLCAKDPAAVICK